MLKLAERYAKLKRTRVLSHRMDGDSIIFVLASGPKLRKTEAELNQAIAALEMPDEAEGETNPAREAPKKSKPKKEKENVPA